MILPVVLGLLSAALLVLAIVLDARRRARRRAPAIHTALHP